MKTIQRIVQNGKGEFEPVPLNSTQGMSLMNAAGDINTSSTGYQYAITTLTYLKKQLTTQKFYEVSPFDYVPIAVGEGSFSDEMVTNLTFSDSGTFEAGLVNDGAANARIAGSESSIAKKSIKINKWNKQITYSILQVEQALRANNWDYIYSLHEARAKNWQLGIQKVAFVGLDDDTPGLLTNPDVNTNTTFITAPIGELSAANFNTFIAGLISTYFTNSNSTVTPDTFVIPQSDFFALQTPFPSASGVAYPVPRINYMLEAFKAASLNPNFKILPSAYADAGKNPEGKQIYALYRMDATSIRMDIPINLTTTQPNSGNNYQFQDVAYGQFTGVGVYRPLETLYFKYTPAS